MEASLAFRIQQRSTMRIFMSEHKWKGGLPTEEEATMMLNQGDDSAIPVPAVFMFVPRDAGGCELQYTARTKAGERGQLHGGGGDPGQVVSRAPDLGRPDDPLRAAGGDLAGVRDDKRFSLRRDAARHHPLDADECQDTMSAEAAVAAE
ncbi:hypothetical protein E5D57_007672 [Metarhizium anisopliae]|nr:hypothetical protein E5D57_007672 [Metarhizium anisopliae]